MARRLVLGTSGWGFESLHLDQKKKKNGDKGMKKILIGLLATLAISGTLTSCGNKRIFDTVYTYDTAIIELPNGEIVEGKVDNWCDYEDGDQLQIEINGKIYLVHSSQVALIQK